ncbi:hypothetical protein HHX47_DHR7000409, partial [Lentinula edodes]
MPFLRMFMILLTRVGEKGSEQKNHIKQRLHIMTIPMRAFPFRRVLFMSHVRTGASSKLRGRNYVSLIQPNCKVPIVQDSIFLPIFDAHHDIPVADIPMKYSRISV